MSGMSATPAAAPASTVEDDEGVRPCEGARNWSSAKADADRAPVGDPSKRAPPSWEKLRLALLRFFEGAPKGSDAALGLGIMEDPDGSRYLPFAMLGRGVNLTDDQDDIARTVQRSIVQAQSGIFSIAPDGSGCGLIEWVGWEEFSSALATITAATRDPAFEPRSIQGHVAKCAHGAVKAGEVRQNDAICAMQDSLSPQDMPEDAAPALRSAISRRTRLALACLVDAIAAAGLSAEAGPDAMGLVGQLPRTLFGLIFDQIDDRDRGACAFLSEILKSWDRRRCFSKRWLQDAAGKFTAPKGANQERDEGKGWYALTADNAGSRTNSAPQGDQGAEDKGSRQDAPQNSTNGGEAPADGANHRANKKRGIVQDEED